MARIINMINKTEEYIPCIQEARKVRLYTKYLYYNQIINELKLKITFKNEHHFIELIFKNNLIGEICIDNVENINNYINNEFLMNNLPFNEALIAISDLIDNYITKNIILEK